MLGVGGGCRVIGFILGLLLGWLLLLGLAEIVMGWLFCLNRISSCLGWDYFLRYWSLVILLVINLYSIFFIKI